MGNDQKFAHSAQLLKPTISKFCHSSYVVITLHNSKILLSLQCFPTPQFQTFTNLLIGVFQVSNSTQFFMRQVEGMRQLYLLLLVILLCYNVFCFGYQCQQEGFSNSQFSLEVSISLQKHHPFLQTIQGPPFRQFTPNILVFHAPT